MGHRMRILLPLVLIAFLASACEPVDDQEPIQDETTPPAEEIAQPIDYETELDQFRTDWEATYNTHDADAVSRTFTEDAVIYPQDGSEPVRGRQAIRAFYEESFQGSPQATFGDAVTRGSGNVGWSSGTVDVTGTLPDGQSFEQTVRYLVVSVREGNEWRIRELMLQDLGEGEMPAAPEEAADSPEM